VKNADIDKNQPKEGTKRDKAIDSESTTRDPSNPAPVSPEGEEESPTKKMLQKIRKKGPTPRQTGKEKEKKYNDEEGLDYHPSEDEDLFKE
jgi:hypothetical protein